MTISSIDAQANDAIANSHESMGCTAIKAFHTAKKFDRPLAARSFMEDAAFHFLQASILWENIDHVAAVRARCAYTELRRTITEERME